MPITAHPHRVRPKLFAAFACLLALGSAAHARPQEGAIWDGKAGNGLWFSALNWNNNIVPNNSGPNTWWVVTGENFVGSGSTIIINGALTLDKMAIALNDTVHLANGQQLTFIGQTDNKGVTGTFACIGDFYMDSSGGFTDLRITGGELVTGNNGQNSNWYLSDHPNNRVYGLAATDRLVVDQLHHIRGAGQIGVNQLRLSNHGFLENQNYANVMTIDLAGTDNFNYGTIQAAYGSRVVILNSTIDNTDGLIAAYFADASVDLAGAVITGGLLQTGSGGGGDAFIRITGNDTVLTDLQNAGVLVALNDLDPIVQGTINNTGEIRLNSTGGFTDMRINSPEFNLINLGGTGQLNLSQHTNNRIYGINGLRRFIHGPTHTIRGSGQIGVNSNLNLTNNGTINAHTGDTIILDLSAGQNFNNNYMTATNGGIFRIQDTVLDNSSGILYASNTGSRIDLAGAYILNGQLLTDFGGEVRVVGNDTTFENVHGNAHVVVPNDLDPILVGSYNNVQMFDMNSSGGFTDLRLNSDVTINGPGVMNLSNHPNNRMFGINGPRRLTNAAGHTIRGSGQIGVNSNFNLTNNGVIRADQPNALTFDLSAPGAGGNFNNNLIEAVNGGVVVFADTVLNNSAGVIAAQDGSRIDLVSSRLFGGVIQTSGSGYLRFTGNDGILQDITLNGRTVVPNDLDPILEGTVLNNGMFEVNSTGGFTDVRANSMETTLGGTGELVFSEHANNRLFGIGGLRRFINGAGHTIRGAVQLGVNSNLNVTNRGTIIAESPIGIVVDVTNDFTNEGLVHLTGAGVLTFNPGALINAPGGTMMVDAGKTIVASNGMTMTGGTLKGNGTFQGAVTNNAGSVAPGASVGHLKIVGNYVQGADASLDIEINGLTPYTLFDVLTVNGAATLGGSVNVTFPVGFEPPIGASFVVMSANSLSGQFAQVTGAMFDVVYRTHTVTLVYQGPLPECGDADVNCDGFVNVDDLLLVISSWGNCPTPPEACPADVAPIPNGDGVVNVDDLLAVIANWG